MERRLTHWIILAGIVILAAVLRWVGINWDDYNHSHPDELFLTTITSEIGDSAQFEDTVRERCGGRGNTYFNTRCSALNPNNIEPGSFAYGTLPVFMVNRATHLYADLTGDPIWRGFDGVHLVGRFVNILADLVSVVMVYLIGRRLFGPQHGLLAAALYAAAVLPIQLAHFWTVDIIAHTFFLIALYAAVLISQQGHAWAFVLFGLALGASGASRINTLIAAALAPLAAYLYFRPLLIAHLHTRDWRALRRVLGRAALLLVLAGAVSFLVFRLGQPYAFKGPHFWNILPNDKWLDDIEEVSNYSLKQDNGWPPSHQFVGQPAYLYPWFNMVMWGMGLLLGLLVTAAFFAALTHQIRQRRLSIQVGLFSAWVILYFGWHGRLHFATMRYFLPVYAVLCLLGVWWLSQLRPRPARWARSAALIGTFVWAFAFTAIYRHPQSRTEAAEWINERFPATVTAVETDGSQQPMSLEGEMRFRMVTFFKPATGSAPPSYTSETATVIDDNLTLRRLWLRWVEPVPVSVVLELFHLDDDELGEQQLFTLVTSSTDPYELRMDLPTDQQITLAPGKYRWQMTLDWPGEPPRLHMIPMVEWMIGEDWGISPIRLVSDFGASVVPYAFPNELYPHVFTVYNDATLAELRVPHAIGAPGDLILLFNGEEYTARYAGSDGRESLLGESRRYVFDSPVAIPGQAQVLITSEEPLWITGTAIATEGDWDTSTPTRICFRDSETQLGYQPYASCRNITGYDTQWYVELPLQVVEADHPKKQVYMLDTLLKADYLTLSSNRMYDALPRNERLYWFMDHFYHDLFGGRLGYEQIARFESWPRLGPLGFPDQALPDQDLPDWLNSLEAEEAFTVYDHPAIYVFENRTFTPDTMTPFVPRADMRNRIDLSDVAGTTYTAPDSVPSEGTLWLIVVGWAAVFIALGWVAFPLVYVLFPGLPLRGFGIGRGVAWLLLAVVPWWLTALLDLPLWSRGALVLVTILFIALNAALFWRHRAAIRDFVRAHWRAMIALELLWLAAFAFGVVLRAMNPDYWHRWLGGEKHMDLAYLNAVWRTGEFPPPNPWLSGFNINYYYLGFVIAAMPLKLFGIPPEIAANLVLATLYGVIFVQVFYLGFALLHAIQQRWRIMLAALGTLLVMLAGNLGTLYMLLGFGKDPEAHRWYWYPTRIIGESANGGGGVINEMPLFSFLYGDLHAHILALLPVTLLLIVLWAFVRQGRAWLTVLIGALLGLIYMTNTWDILVYVPLVAVVVLVVGWRNIRWPWLLVLLAAGGIMMGAPYLRDFTLSDYSGLKRWEGPRTLLGPFLLVWGGPLVVLGLWLAHRARRLLAPNADVPVELGLLILLAGPAVIIGGEDGTSVLLAVLLLVALLLAWRDRSGRLLHLAAAFFFAGLLTIEHFMIKDDIDRMNTSFKVSFQLWIWVGLLIPCLLYRLVHDHRAYALAALGGIALLPGFLFPLKAIPARHEDAATGQFSLNGYAFMDVMQFTGDMRTIRLNTDADLIRFMRSRITGYPVIAEAYQREYYWNLRISSYTGLPSVIGWQNHLRQQYPHHDKEVLQRVEDIQWFYLTDNPDEILALVRKYNIRYIVSGELEQAIALSRQLVPLEQLVLAGRLSVVYENGMTRLYRVEDSSPLDAVPVD